MKQISQKLLNKFNVSNSVLVISPYSEKGVKYSGRDCAIGSLAKNTLNSMNQYFKNTNQNRKFVVLTIISEKEEIYEENGVLVCRIFRRNDAKSYLKLFKTINKFNQINKSLIEFEFGSYGKVKTVAFFPAVLWYLKIIGKNPVLVLHQILKNLSDLSGHLGWGKNDFRSFVFDFFFKKFLFALTLPAKKIVVLEEELKQRLISLVGMEDKIKIIPHGVDQDIKIINKEKARKILGINKNQPVCLYFGYLTWYKGVDFLVKTFVENKIRVDGKEVKLIVAGGESATLKDEEHYQKFVKDIYRLARSSSSVKITGFIDEKKIPFYFSAADLVVLPYRTFMSSSGPLSLTFSYKKPFIISSSLKNYFKTEDFKNILQRSDLKEDNISFGLNDRSLISAIRDNFNSQRLLALSNFAAKLGNNRTFINLAPNFMKVIDDQSVELEKASVFSQPQLAHDLNR